MYNVFLLYLMSFPYITEHECVPKNSEGKIKNLYFIQTSNCILYPLLLHIFHALGCYDNFFYFYFTLTTTGI